MQQDCIRAFWMELPLRFDATPLRPCINVIKLKSNAIAWSQSVMYDVVRLELDETTER